MNFSEWLEEANKKDPSNILAPGGLTPDLFQQFLVDELLGPDWYIAYSCNGDQARVEILCAILKKYRKNNLCARVWKVIKQGLYKWYMNIKEWAYAD